MTAKITMRLVSLAVVTILFIAVFVYLNDTVVDIVPNEHAQERPSVPPSDSYGTWRGVTVGSAARRPCFVTRCPKAKVSDFKHWDSCNSVKSVADIARNGARHILPTAAKRQGFDSGRMEFFARPVDSDGAGGGVAFGQRSDAETAEDSRCAVGATPRWKLESCVDPRYPLRLPLAVHRAVDGAQIACYARGDILCESYGKHGSWEAGLSDALLTAARGMGGVRREQFNTYRTALLAYRGIKALPGGPQPKDATEPFGVEYYDIGGNVGSLAIRMQRGGYPTKVFEALPQNMQLLSTSKCLNGLRPSFFDTNGTDVHLVAGDGDSSMEPSGRGVGDEDPFRLFHVALGDVPDQRCVMVSHPINFGDVIMKCNKTDVENTAADAFGMYERRGFVEMTTMDRVLHYTADDAAMCARFGRPLEHSSPQRHGAVAELHKAADTAAAGRESGHAEGPAPKLPEDFFSRDYIVKIDIEGHELSAMSGARKWLSAPHRPRMLLSEVWATLDITAYGQLMLEHGYVGFVPRTRAILMVVHDFKRFHKILLKEDLAMDNIIFVEERWAGKLLPKSSFGARRG